MKRGRGGKEQRKDSIKRAALDLFKTYGVKRVSINDIARQAAVSPVTIYNHFGSKDELVHQVFQQFAMDWIDKCRLIINSDTPFPDKLETIIFDKTELLRQYNLEFIQTTMSQDPEMQQFMESMLQGQLNQLWTDLFHQGRRQGCIHPDVSQQAFMLYVQMMSRGAMAIPNLLPLLEQNTDLMQELGFLLLYGIINNQENRQRSNHG